MRTKLHKLCYNGDYLKNYHSRVILLVHDTSSERALHMYVVSLNGSNGYEVIERTQFCDGQTHGQTQGGNIHARVMVRAHDTLSCA